REARETFDSELFTYWGKRDPIGLFETVLVEGPIDLETNERGRSQPDLKQRNTEYLSQVEARITQEVERAAEEALASVRDRMPRGESGAQGVYSDSVAKKESSLVSSRA